MKRVPTILFAKKFEVAKPTILIPKRTAFTEDSFASQIFVNVLRGAHSASSAIKSGGYLLTHARLVFVEGGISCGRVTSLT